MTVKEFFVRYPDLKDFLLDHLTSPHSDDRLLVNPSTVPLLTMLTHLTPGGSSTDVTDTFKAAFKALFHSPVINVRRLAVKARISGLKSEFGGLLF